MKITNSEVIKSGEKDLIDSITADLDWGAIENIFLTEHNLGIDEDIEYKRGDIIAFNNQVAYKLEFTVKVNLSVLINRDGEYLSVKVSDKKDDKAPEDPHEFKNPEAAGEGTEKDVIEKNEGHSADVRDFSGDNSGGKPINSDSQGMQDRYFEALEQIGTNDSGENA